MRREEKIQERIGLFINKRVKRKPMAGYKWKILQNNGYGVGVQEVKK